MDKTKKHILKRAGTCVAVVLMLYLFNRLTNQAFFSQRNLTMLLKQASVLMILTSSLMLLLIETNIDLSGGAGVYLSGVTCALLVVKCGWPIFPAIVVTIMVGIMMGAVNGFFIGRIGLPAFIVTLAAQQIFRGTGYVLTDCATIGPMPKQFTAISENFIPPAISVAAVILIFAAFAFINLRNYRRMGKWYGTKGHLVENLLLGAMVAAVAIWVFYGYKGIPMAAVIAGLIAFMSYIITTKTTFGRKIFLIGGNKEASRLAGINIENIVFKSYLYEGLMYGIGGIVLTARLGGAASTGGKLLELDAVAAACIGGVSMSGGAGSIMGCISGVLILTAIDNVMSLMNISSYLQMVIKGIILLFAVCLDLYTNKAKFKFKLKK